MEKTIYAPPLTVDNPNDCYFYHSIDLPGHGLITGDWDLRANVDDYLGRVDVKGKKVLEVGTANGYLCFEMERRGAEVTGYDLSPAHDWDYVPFNGKVDEDLIVKRKDNIRRLNRAWWLGHRCFNSRARVVYGPVYQIPESIGPVDISTFGAILLHLRDPFLAIQKAANITRETIIVTDLMPSYFSQSPTFGRYRLYKHLFWQILKPSMVFMPDPATKSPNDTWWNLPPKTICHFLNMLGFQNQQVLYHTQMYKTHKFQLYTVVGRRSS
jgi:hypothetical protein